MPELDEALGIDGRAVDYLYSCWGFYQEIDGRPVPFELYFTNWPFYTNDIRFETPWDSDHWRRCDGQRYPTDGRNPCPTTGKGHPPRLFPSHWEYPEISAGGDDVIDLGEGFTLWWH